MDFAVIPENLPFLLGGLLVSIKLTAITILLAFPLGSIIALGRISSNRWIYYLSTAFVNVLRSNPLILIIFWFYFLVPLLIKRPVGDFASVVIAFTIFFSAYFAEIVRSGIQSVREGQLQAGLSTGLTYLQIMRYIVLPQAIRNMVPALFTQCVIVLQGTTVAFVIGIKELLHRTNLVNENTLRSLELYAFTAFIYFVLCYSGSTLSKRFEKKKV